MILCIVYTQPKPEGAYDPDLRTLALDADAARGMVILDIVSGLIAHVEVLNRDDVRRPLFTALP